MANDISKINSKFRHLCDLLLFSECKHIDLSSFKNLLEADSSHSIYLWDRFKKSCEIFWENGDELWLFRFKFLIDSGGKSLLKEIESFLEKKFFGLIRSKKNVSLAYDIEYLQFIQFCKAKFEKNQNLLAIKNKLIELIPQLKIEKIISIVKDFIPYLFKDMNEFFEIISKRIIVAETNYYLLLALEKQGITFDRKILIKLANEIIIEHTHSDKHARALMIILNDPRIIQGLKKQYTLSHRDKLLSLINECIHYHQLENNQYKNMKNIIALDSALADPLSIIYMKKIINRVVYHKRANVDRIIRLIKTIPQIKSKKILAFLISNNQMSDIRYITKAFPELKKLANFA